MGSNLAVLCLNSGSSSLKLALYRCSPDGEERIGGGSIERIGQDRGSFSLRGPEGDSLQRTERFENHEAAVTAALEAIAERKWPRPDAIGHRLVHGGPEHLAPERVTPELLEALREATPFAPLHLPAEIRAIEVVAASQPELPQVACFDTAFYKTLPDLARRFPLPDALYEQGVRRYGFHGLSYEYLVEELGDALGPRTILAHLGNGSSMTAMRDGRPIDTTMGLTPTGGLMMGTRSGNLDPGLIVFLLDNGHDVRDVERIVNREAGLLGVSDVSSDMKIILEKRNKNERAALAFEMFCYQARKWVGALAAALGGVDSLVFTGGIGEHAAPVRERICAGLGFAGIQIDRSRNRVSADVISPDSAPCTVRVEPTDEELMIARHTRRVIAARPTTS